jgi:hypothetical protein
VTNSAKEYLSSVRHVNGWFSIHDVAMFQSCLQLQNGLGATGNILEIGVFEGKSAILLGLFLTGEEELHLCDTFGLDTNGLNKEENLRSYPGLSKDIFLQNYLRFNLTPPRIYQCKSSDLTEKISNIEFRIIHIDGSHIYENVKFDLQLATSLLNKEAGILVVDDFRAQHTFGVALALWELVSLGEFIPIALTASKIYLVHSSSKIFTEDIVDLLGEVPYMYEYLNGRKFIRTLGMTDVMQYQEENFLKTLIPPLLLNLLTRNSIWKKLRELGS